MTATMTAAGMPTREQALPAPVAGSWWASMTRRAYCTAQARCPITVEAPGLGDSPGSSRKTIPASRQASGPGRRARR
jgi:hypothetical protein